MIKPGFNLRLGCLVEQAKAQALNVAKPGGLARIKKKASEAKDE
jgi:hypothetical protein